MKRPPIDAKEISTDNYGVEGFLSWIDTSPDAEAEQMAATKKVIMARRTVRRDDLDLAHLALGAPGWTLSPVACRHGHALTSTPHTVGSRAALKLQSFSATKTTLHAHFPVRSCSSLVSQLHLPSTTMPVASKIAFVHFTPRYTDLPRKVYRSDRDTIRGDLREGFDTTLGESRITTSQSVRRH